MLGRPRTALLVVSTACLVSIAAFASVAASSSAAVASGSQKLTIYSVAEREQYVNNSDARKGGGKNPFGNYKDLKPTDKNSKGPFPGDEALFSFKLFANASLKSAIGAAIFTCQYNFAKNAFCEATLQLKGGTLIASGAFNFNASQFSLAVTGGTGKYSNATGVIAETPTTNHAQKLSIRLGTS